MSIEHPTGRDPGQTPAHYRHPSGLEAIHISLHLPHPLASAFEYVWRAGKKESAFDDLRKALEWLKAEGYRRRQVQFPQKIPHLLRTTEQMRTVCETAPGVRSDALMAIFDSVNDSGEEKLRMAIRWVVALAATLLTPDGVDELTATVNP